VFTKKVAIIIHGCYWHGHECGSRYTHSGHFNRGYWGPIIERTKQRDKDHFQILTADGWGVIVLWECEIKEDYDRNIFKAKPVFVRDLNAFCIPHIIYG